MPPPNKRNIKNKYNLILNACQAILADLSTPKTPLIYRQFLAISHPPAD